MDDKEKKPKLSKGVIAAFIAMGAVIVLLVILLLVTNLSKDNPQPETSGMVSQASDTTSAGSEPTPSGTDINTSAQESEPAESTPAEESSSAGGSETQTTPSYSESAPAEPSDTDSAPAETSQQQSSENTDTPQEPSKPAEEKPAEQTKGYTISYASDSSWESSEVSMYGAKFGITNNSGKALNGWTLKLTIPNLANCEGWNGTYTVSGNTLTITNADYNGEIGNGGSLSVGCNLGIKGSFKVTDAELNGVKCTVVAGTVADNPQNGNSGNGGQQNNQQQNNQNGQGGNTPSASVEQLLERSDKAVQGDDWLHTDGNRILDKNNKQVWLTGVNWFGYNTGTNIFDGLWNSELESSVKAIADHGFNLIRVPISAQLINQWAAGEYPRANYNQAYNTTLNDMNSLEIFDYFLVLAEKNGMKVMPDIHSAETDASGHNVNLWYTSKVSVEEFYSALEWLADRYKDNDTIIAIDLKNEPHGKPFEGSGAAIWNDSTAANNWKYVAEQAAKRILAKNPNVLIMVEGTEIYSKKNGDYSSTNEKDYYFNWWGGNLRGVKDYPVNLGKYQDKLVYSPHDYGPTVFEQPWFKGNYTYDSLMNDCWRDNWLYIHTDNTAPLLIGEWGGFMREPNLTWMTYMRQLIKNYHLNHTFWCFNANSGDTGGLVLDDFKTWDDEKYNFVKEVLWQENGKFVGLDHAIPLGENGITLTAAKGLG